MRRTPRKFRCGVFAEHVMGSDRWRVWPAVWYGTIKVPLGFETDFMSVPAPFRAFINPCGPGVEAAVLHDYLLSRGVRWPVAAAFFREALRHSGISWGRAWVAWAGVVCWGWLKGRR